MAALVRSIRRAGLEGEVEVVARGCFGLCKLAPNLYIEPEGVWYSRFTLKDVPVIVRRHLRNNRLVKRLIHYPERLVRPKPRWTKAKVVQRGKRKRRIPSGRSARVKRDRSR